MKISMESYKDMVYYYVIIHIDYSLFAFINTNGINFDYPENIIGVDEL